MNNVLSPLFSFKDQFSFSPLFDTTLPGTFDSVVVCGMGGSAISAHLIKLFFKDLPISVYSGYGEPLSFGQNPLFIIQSYSGETEEVLDNLKTLLDKKKNIAIITKGGLLLNKAKENAIPYIVLPEDEQLEPRFAIGHQMIAILSILGESKKLQFLREAVAQLDIETSISVGEKIANTLFPRYPVFYSSLLLSPLAHPIKAAVNEGAKLPSFAAVIPEANHNELQSFIVDEHQTEKDRFSLIFLKSTNDHPRIQKRLEIMKSLYEKYGFVTEEFVVDDTDISSCISVIIAGYSFATHYALMRNVEPYKTPFIAEFKKNLL